MLEFNNVKFRYEGTEEFILDNLSFNVADGEFICVIGASGCGKSTIFRVLNGLEEITSGEILVDHTNIQRAKNYSSYMPQKDLLFPWRTIENNVMLPMEIQGVPKEQRTEMCNEMLDKVGLYEYKDKFPRELSAGMRQRVSFARTLCAGANLLLLDEPFSALDSLTKVNLQEWLQTQWLKLNKTILFITHDVEEALFLSQKIFLIRERPITEIEMIEIPMDFPRKREDLARPEIVALKEKLIKSLRQDIKE